MLFDSHVLPLMAEQVPDPKVFRRVLKEPAVAEVYAYYSDKLPVLFQRYAAMDKSIKERNDRTVSLREFEMMFQHYGFDKTLTKRQLWHVFIRCRDENQLTKSYTLHYPSFLEAIFRAAMTIYGTPTTSLHHHSADDDDPTRVAACARQLFEIITTKNNKSKF